MKLYLDKDVLGCSKLADTKAEEKEKKRQKESQSGGEKAMENG